jgi:hypothetical protein
VSSTISERTPAQQASIAKAQAAHLSRAANRAVDDPAELARAARIVRAALERRRLTIGDVQPASEPRDAA